MEWPKTFNELTGIKNPTIDKNIYQEMSHLAIGEGCFPNQARCKDQEESFLCTVTSPCNDLLLLKVIYVHNRTSDSGHGRPPC